MGLLTNHFQNRAIERFGRPMTEQEARDHWERGYPVDRNKLHRLHRLHLRPHRHSVYRVVIVDHIPAIMVRNTLTWVFRTII